MSGKTKKKNKGLFRRISDWLHLWLGLSSGAIVFIVSITGCFYAFQQEIKDALEPWRFVQVQSGGFVPPSLLLDTASKYMPDARPTGLTYSNEQGAAAIGYSGMENGKRTFSVVFMDPYTGSFLKKQQTIGTGEFDFFRFIIDGHRALWLPYEIGRPIVGVATLIFLALLITGMIMWWPKKWNRTARGKSFKIKWSGRFKRLNYDLHNVLGFYSLLFALALAVTGLVWSFAWFDKGLYFIASMGEHKQEHHHPHSDISQKDRLWSGPMTPLDSAWYATIKQVDKIGGMYMTPILQDEDDSYEILIYHNEGSYYNQSAYFYDRYTLEPLEMNGSKFNESKFADRLTMMNYDIHVGSILGLPGKVFAFLISLICASLPITGFLVWWNKRKKAKIN
ncbi:PepSY domain-containing protein [Sphingobacterium sp. JB170]|uniref:PepSY-associated TM helix domain-containing protein n=1 Tax=Sphingobacterium sp. JB170 TaxID=1434842 RepID=UPI00097EB7E2|nr:PepSY-associated TM helix domain-containing protein [Sphingobacterium sp. JB170]SJN47774.1 putative iron-regulated membrane protein [Sphingobacterium sp. JB170]